MTRRSAFATTVILFSGIGLLAAVTDGFRAFTSETARRLAILEQPVTIPAATLQSHTGEELHLGDLSGRVVVIDFIFTRCPTVCHALGAQFRDMADELQGMGSKAVLLSISFDPDFDHPQQLMVYLRRYGELRDNWLAVRIADKRELRSWLERFGVVVIPTETGYDHNAAVHIIDPQGRLVAILDYEATQQILDTVDRIASESVS
ncbi:MAG: SCO family protein [Gammaproteobacteria bacterium]|jgi:protein SCO1/2|nr:SCO family protein [Gammaproteobacteria bacterium]MDP6617433.1 SCO family protein [Gammaproteobacteria bacterium]